MKKLLLYLMALLYIAVGINHFLHPQFYLAIMPSWIGYHQALVLASGICEIVFALLLIPIATRTLGAWLIILLLGAVFPANVQMMLNYYHEHNPNLWISIVRLPLQLLLIWWAYIYARKPNK